MSDITGIMNMQFADSLIGYLEVRSWAFNKICASPIDSNLIDLKMHHYLYFTNLFGAIDLVRDSRTSAAEKKAFDDHMRKDFAAPGNYAYARELRNAIVHRGLDLVAHGLHPGWGEKSQYVFAMSPAVVFHKDGEKAYVCTFPHLVDLAAACDRASNAAIYAVIEREGLLDPAAYMLEPTQTFEMEEETDDMPEWDPDTAAEPVNPLEFEAMAAELAQARAQQLQSLLAHLIRRPKAAWVL
jgi:hypothetical protein